MRFQTLANVLSIVVAIFFIVPPTTFSATSSDISVNVVPANPAPNQDVSLSLSSYGLNLDVVSIKWYVNGKNVLSGTGQKTLSTSVGAAGTDTNISAIVSLPEGDLEKRILLRPNTIVLLWQATDSYTPPFYKGKAMPTLDSEIKVVALPEIKTSSGSISASGLTYSWRKDYSNDQDNSGYGRNYLIYNNDYLDEINTIQVNASTADQGYSVDGSINIGTVSPELVFYKRDKKLGTLWDEALSNTHFIDQEEILVAAPYFIAPKNLLNPRLVFNWFINNNLVNLESIFSNMLPLKTEEGRSGTSKVRLEINNKDRLFQNVSKEINIQF